MRRGRIPARHRDLVFAVLTSAGMSIIINLVIAAVNCGMGRCTRFMDTFLSGTATGFVIGVPAALWLVPQVAKLVDRIVEEE